ncbi:MAG: DNA-binding protein WhiA [Clostridia bacterium]|nr:DNA-binding protein WhiA [Clostridia bacterium]
MSFTSDIRDELGQLPIKPLCCRRAYLYGLIYGAEVAEDTVMATFPVVKDAAYHPHEQAVSLIHTLFSREASVSFISRGAHRYAHLTFHFKAAAKNLRTMAELPEAEAECETLARHMGFKCEHCAAHFLRGVFISSGTVNDPAKSYHLEIKLPSDGRVEPLRILLAESGYEGGQTGRNGLSGLFFKSGNTIQELLAFMGATSSVFDFFNAQIERSIRNDENRATNCVTENINRAIRTGAKHLAAIQYLEDHDLIPALPENLQFTARLRLNNPDITLSELAELHFPPVSKSGVYHRLEKVMAFYEKNVKNTR